MLNDQPALHEPVIDGNSPRSWITYESFVASITFVDKVYQGEGSTNLAHRQPGDMAKPRALSHCPDFLQETVKTIICGTLKTM